MAALILITVLLLIFVVLAVLFIAKLGSAKAGGGEYTVARPPQGHGYVEETLTDDGENYYHVKRGQGRTFVHQARAGAWKKIVYETILVGVNYHPEATKRFLNARAPWLDLEREPDNKHDPNAIKVMSTWRKPDGTVHREHIGYVSREEAAVIS